MQGRVFFQCPEWKQALADSAGTEISYEQGLYPNDEQWVRLDTKEQFETIHIYVRFGDHHDLDRQIWRLLLLLETLGRVTDRIEMTLPYVPYSLQNRDARGGDAVGLKVFLDTLHSRKVQLLRVVDLHSRAGLGDQELPIEHLLFEDVACDALRLELGESINAIVAPDESALSRAQVYADRLNLPVYTFQKTRHGAGDVSLRSEAQDLPDSCKNIVIVDDMINTGSTLIAVTQSLRERGKKVWCITAHGLFAGMAYKKLKEAGVEKIFISDSFDSAVMRQPKEKREMCKRVSLAPLFV
jgi:ribose-phosphate pyrophosphokinase